MSVQPDPSMIGGVAKAPFVLTPDPNRVFRRRSERFERLAEASPLGPFLRFLGVLSHVQAEVAAGLAPQSVSPAQVERARDTAMPPIDRLALADSPDLESLLDRLFDLAAAIDKPEAAAVALETAQAASPEERRAMLSNVLGDAIPVDSLAPHLYVAAGVQVHLAALAATLDANRLGPVATGVCPACGGPPVASLVVGFQSAEGARYAVCACCATQWNEVRVKCLACGSTKGIGYREVEGGTGAATIKAEVCDECRSWVKVLYQNNNPGLDPVADDVGSLGLDMLMRGTDYRRAGLNPFLLGY